MEATAPYEPPDPDNPAYWRKPTQGFDAANPPPVDSRDRLPWLMVMIGWSSAELARRLDVNPETARQWVSGRSRMPEIARAWLEDLAACHLARLKPSGWGR
jgi:hypothetical protein